MTKSRFTTTDVIAMVRDCRSLILGQRVSNIYDLSDKVYLFKFAIPGKSEKTVLLLESGIRFHTTKFARDKSDMPSPFAVKLRKHIRTKRLEDIHQLGNDRVVDFKFGSGDVVSHVILELYASGNIVLTDGNYEILALLRSHQFEDDIAVKVNQIYPMAYTSTIAIEPNSITNSKDNQETENLASCSTSILSMTSHEFLQWAITKESQYELQQVESNEKNAGKKNKSKKLNLRQFLLLKDSGVSSYGPEILDHCILSAGLKNSTKMSELQITKSEDECIIVNDDNSTCTLNCIDKLLILLKSAQSLFSLLDSPGQPGYILYNDTQSQEIKNNDNNNSSSSSEELIRAYTEFTPYLFKQHEGKEYLQFPSFDEAVDEYFCKVEEQKLVRQANSAEEVARSKVAKVKNELYELMSGLEEQQKQLVRGASLVEAFAEDVDKVLLVVNSALSSGMSWEDLDHMVQIETAAGNPIAGLISKLKLEKNMVVLRLPNLFEFEFEEEDPSTAMNDASLVVVDDDDVDKKNVSELHDLQESSHGDVDAELEQLSPVKKGNKKASSKTNDNSTNGQSKKDKLKSKSQQSNSNSSSTKLPLKEIEVEVDLSLSAYANAGRMYSDRKVFGAKQIKTEQASVKAIKAVEKQTSKVLETQKIRRTLQAVRKVHWFEKFNWFITSEGYLVLSGRDAQQNEALVKRYLRPGDAYVHADVNGASSCILRHKTSPPKATVTGTTISGGETLPLSPIALQEAGNMTGSFMIYGKKNYTAPMPQEMGFGILFRLDDSSVTRHLGERKDKVNLLKEEDDELIETKEEDYPVKDNNDSRKDIIEIDEIAIPLDTVEQQTQPSYHEETISKIPNTNDDVIEEDGEEVVEVEKEDASPKNDTTEEDIKKIKDISLEDTSEIVLESKARLHTRSDEANKLCNDVKSEEGRSGGGGGRLTAAERRQLKKMKSKGVPLPANAEILQTIRNKIKNEQMQQQQEEQNQDTSDEEDQERENEEVKNTIEPLETSDPPQESSSASNKSMSTLYKKPTNKKKARKYANQDEEDRILSMQALGHIVPGRDSQSMAEKRAEEIRIIKDREMRQEKAGVKKLTGNDWMKSLDKLSAEPKVALIELVNNGVLKPGEIDAFEIKTLSSFPPLEGMKIIQLFTEGDNLRRIGNKSGFLAGIMRRFAKDKDKGNTTIINDSSKKLVSNMKTSVSNKGKSSLGTDSATVADNSGDFSKGERGGEYTASEESTLLRVNEGSTEEEARGPQSLVEDDNDLEDQDSLATDTAIGGDGVGGLSRRERKKLEAAEVQAILLEEGALDEEEGKQADELEKLTGCPLPEDTLLYAVPVCGPYSVMQNYKYRVKLTPGTTKKGKAAKQAIEVFIRGKECSAIEKTLLKGLTDPEMVAIMIGDVKISTPGLHAVQKAKKISKGKDSKRS